MEQYVNLAILLSLVFYIVKIDKRLTRIEMVLKTHGINCKNKEE